MTNLDNWRRRRIAEVRTIIREINGASRELGLSTFVLRKNEPKRLLRSRATEQRKRHE